MKNNKSFYPTLAWNNIKRNSKSYVPYIITCIGTIAMFFICVSLHRNESISQIKGGGSLTTILGLGTIVIGIFSFIFLFYTNSFILKQRKKEIGLYNVLGMGKKHIAVVMLWESLFVFLISIAAGLIAGVLFNRLAFLLLLKILRFSTPLVFSINFFSISVTAALFLGIFIFILLNTLRQIQISNPVDLLRDSKAGEREPKVKWLLALLGATALAAGYYIALTTESPLDSVGMFFIAVLLVILGTYLLFIAGSIALLKLLRKNKSYYYKAKHFTGISGMIYRMKQNAVGLANICILSTAILVMLTSTVALNAGLEDIIITRFPHEIHIRATNVSSEADKQMLDNYVSDYLKDNGINCSHRKSYLLLSYIDKLNGNNFSGSKNASNSGENQVCLMTLQSYNSLHNLNADLEADELFVYSTKDKFPSDTVTFNGIKYKVKAHLNELDVDGLINVYTINAYYFIAQDTAAINKIVNSYTDSEYAAATLNYYCSMDWNCSTQQKIDARDELRLLLSEKTNNDNDDEDRIKVYVDSREESRESMYATYGGLLFLGIFLGLLFIIATVLIMYYKQVSEGYDDKERFRIMQNVGMTKKEVKKSIRSQVLTVFFLPLIAAVVHIAFAFPIIIQLMALLNFSNSTLYFQCTIAVVAVFALFYTIVFSITSRVYYRIVD